jgi:uncharacterized protein (DUF983 family)
MLGPMLAAISGRCPSCQKGAIYKSFLKAHELCPVCSVRFERWAGSWTIPVVMGYGSGAIFAVILGFILLKLDRLEGAENIIIPATIAFTLFFYPLCKNISYGLMFSNGFIYPDPPQLVKDPEVPKVETPRNQVRRPTTGQQSFLSAPRLPDPDTSDEVEEMPTTMETPAPPPHRRR